MCATDIWATVTDACKVWGKSRMHATYIPDALNPINRGGNPFPSLRSSRNRCKFRPCVFPLLLCVFHSNAPFSNSDFHCIPFNYKFKRGANLFSTVSWKGFVSSFSNVFYLQCRGHVLAQYDCYLNVPRNRDHYQKKSFSCFRLHLIFISDDDDCLYYF